MSAYSKFKTALRLIAHLDYFTLRRQWRINTAGRRLGRNHSRPFVHRDPGFPFVCHPEWADSRDQFLNNAGDHWEFQVLRRWLQLGDTVLDVGANLGLYTFLAADCVGACGRVVAVEASPYIVEKLAVSARVLAISQVLPMHAAVTQTPGTITFYVSRDQTITGEQSLQPSAAQRAGCVAIDVPALTLEDIDRDQHLDSKLTLVKIDIEGAEADALSATPPAWLDANGPLWLVEINPSALARFGATPSEILAYFPENYFDCWLLPKHPFAPGGSTKPRPIGTGWAADFSDSLYYNFFALPKGPQWTKRAERVRPMFPFRTS